LFRLRLGWAVATALLLAVSVFAFYLIANRGTNPMKSGQQLAGSRPTEAAPPSTPTEESRVVPPAGTVKNSSPVRGLAGIHQPQARKGTVAARAQTPPATVISADTGSMSAEATPERNNLAEPDVVPARDPVPSEKTLRVEIQTRDPNIRIIWFTPQPAKPDSQSKTPKGT